MYIYIVIYIYIYLYVYRFCLMKPCHLGKKHVSIGSANKIQDEIRRTNCSSDIKHPDMVLQY